jgi:hypothetical protein
MSLPPKSEKGYLKLRKTRNGCSVGGKQEHINELATLYGQYGIRFRRGSEGNSEEDALYFEEGTDQAHVQQIMEAYRDAKGS